MGGWRMGNLWHQSHSLLSPLPPVTTSLQQLQGFSKSIPLPLSLPSLCHFFIYAKMLKRRRELNGFASKTFTNDLYFLLLKIFNVSYQIKISIWAEEILYNWVLPSYFVRYQSSLICVNLHNFPYNCKCRGRLGISLSCRQSIVSSSLPHILDLSSHAKVRLVYEWVYRRLESQQCGNEEEIDGLLSTPRSAKCNNPTNNINGINNDNNHWHHHKDIVFDATCGTPAN